MRAVDLLKEALETERLPLELSHRIRLNLKDGETSEEQRQAARDEHESDEIEIDENAQLSDSGEEGYWVSAWVWVPRCLS